MLHVKICNFILLVIFVSGFWFLIVVLVDLCWGYMFRCCEE